MSFFSKIKNSITGGWAEVTLEVTSASKSTGFRRGEDVDLNVLIKTKSDKIKIERVYVKVICTEEITINNYPLRGIDTSENSIDIRQSTNLFSREIVLSGSVDLNAESSYEFKDSFRIPSDAFASHTGHFAKIEWVVYAGLEMTGNDPNSDYLEMLVI